MLFKNNKRRTLRKTTKRGGSKGATIELKLPSWVIVNEEGFNDKITHLLGGAKKTLRRKRKKSMKMKVKKTLKRKTKKTMKRKKGKKP
jgi:hypothetical protein